MLSNAEREAATASPRVAAATRTTVILVGQQGLSHGECAVDMKVSEGTIAWRMHEARRRLHEAMAPEKVQRPRGLSADFVRLLADHGLPIWAPPLLKPSR